MKPSAAVPHLDSSLSTPTGWSRWRIAGVAGILIMTLIAYANALAAGFIWDDDLYVWQNRLLFEADGLWRIWFSPRESPQYYPMVFTTFWIEQQLWGLDPRGYHLINIVLHACNALLVWRLCGALRIPGAWFIAAVFAVHPVHVESVAWITERKNVLSGLFYLTSGLCYLRFDALRFREGLDESRRQSLRWYGACIVLFTFALLSKSVTCSLPAALILMLLWLRQPLSIRRLLPLLPLFVLGLAAAMHTAFVERNHVGATGEDFAFSLADRAIIASNALLFYPWKLIWPSPLMFNYERWVIDDSAALSYVPALIVLLIAAMGIHMFSRGWRGAPLALSFYAGTIFPALGFFNIYPMQFSFVADHFQYLASLGVITLVIGSIASLHRFRVPGSCIGAVALATLTALTARQSATYESAVTVYRDTLEKNGEAWMPHNNLGLLLVEDDPRQAEFHFRESLRLKSNHYQAAFNLVTALSKQGKPQDAAVQLQSVIERIQALPRTKGLNEPELLARHYLRLAQLNREAGKPDRAEHAFRDALQLAPDDATIHAQLAQHYFEQGRVDEAKSHFQESLDYGGEDSYILRTLGVIAYNKADYAKAIDLLQRSLSAATSANEYVPAAQGLLQILTSCPEVALRDVNRAVTIAEQLNDITRREDPQAIDILASVYADAGRFEDAIRTGEEAIALAKSQGLDPLAAEFAMRVDRYRKGKRARE